MVCYIINTVEYCKDTLDGLESNVKSLFENQSFRDKFSLEHEEEQFNGVINKAMETIQWQFESLIEQELKEIPRNYTDAAFTSQYTLKIKSFFNSNLSIIRETINNVYYTFLLNKISHRFTALYIQNIYK